MYIKLVYNDVTIEVNGFSWGGSYEYRSPFQLKPVTCYYVPNSVCNYIHKIFFILVRCCLPAQTPLIVASAMRNV